MRVLGISVWIHFIWIFVVGVLLFFYTVHGTLFEGFDVTSGSGSGSGINSGSGIINKLDLGFFLGSAPAAVAIQSYSASTGELVPLIGDTDRLLYQQRLPKGARLVSPNRSFVLLYKTNGDLILYDTRNNQIMWKTATGSDSSYIVHQGQLNVKKINGNLGLSPFSIPPDPLAGASGSSGSNAGSTPTGQYFTTSYLQLKDNANLVINKADGTPIWSTNTGSIENTVVCEPQIMSYPFVKSDCVTLDNLINKYNDTINTIKGISGTSGSGSGSGTNTSGTNTSGSGTNTSGSGSGSGSTGTLMNTETGGLSQLIAAKQGICTIQPYYNDLGCRAYISTISIAPPPITELATAIVEPSVSIKGRLNMGTKIITVTGTLAATTIQSGDILYLGYGTDIQGPFTVALVAGQTITLTKNYIGADIINAVISVKRVTRGSNSLPAPSVYPVQMDISKLPAYTCTPGVDHVGDIIQCYTDKTDLQMKALCDINPQCLSYNTSSTSSGCTKSKSNITSNTTGSGSGSGTVTNFCVKTVPIDLIASVYPDVSFIVIDTSTLTTTANATTISDSLPLNLDLGDIIYIKKDTCNTNDVDNGNGTCTAYLCNIGEVDLGDDMCKTYTCGTTNTCTTGTLNTVADTDNGDGTCTTSIVHTCSPSYEGLRSYLRDMNTVREAYTYAKTQFGIPGITSTFRAPAKFINGHRVENSYTYPSYTYSKTLGPYIISMKPSTNKIMIKSFLTGDLTTSGGFILNPMAASHRARRLWLSNTRTGTPPSLVDTVNLKAVPEAGLVNAKLYKVDYVSFKNISVLLAAWNAIIIPTQYSTTVTCGVNTYTSNLNTYVIISNPKIDIGSRYTLTLSVRVISGTVNNTSPGIQLEDSTKMQYDITDKNVSQGSQGVNRYVYLSNIYTTIKWDFTATGTDLLLRIWRFNPLDTVVLEFNRLDIVNIAGYTGVP